MERERFEELVSEAVEGLPDKFKESLRNISIMVADWPTREQLDEVGMKRRQDLLGLYEGVPLTRRSRGYQMVLPDRITVFQRPIELHCRSDDRIVERIQRTVQHEIAHYFGISDDRLREIDRY
mgnify:CR=1 FL=1